MLDFTPLQIDAFAWVALVLVWAAGGLFTHRTRSSESVGQRTLHVIPLYLGFVLMLYHRHIGPLAGRLYGNGAVAWFGTAVTVAAVAFAIWARVTLGRYWSGFITLKEGHRLIMTGPYRFARHPIYTGFVIGSVGTALSAGSIDGFIGAAMVTASLVRKLRREERLLTTEFGEEYVRFRRDVPAAVVPFVY